MGVPDYLNIKLYNYNCCRTGCDAIVILPDSVDSRLRESLETFYCYRGHGQSYGDTGEKEKLKKKLKQMTESRDREIKRKEWALQAEKKAELRRRAAKGQLTKMQNRIKNGVCPCCRRTFSNLTDHMANQHPDYGDKE
jgi:hypothetical protein